MSLLTTIATDLAAAAREVAKQSSAALAILQKQHPTSSELRAALAALDQAAAERIVNQLEEQRRSLLLTEGMDKQIDEMDARINAAVREVEKLSARKGELARRLVDVERHEELLEIDAMADEGRMLERRLIDRFVEFDEAARRLADVRTGIEADMKRLETINGFLGDHDRSGLRSKTPRQLLRERGHDEDKLPVLTGWVMPGYFPVRPDRSGPFALARELRS